MKSFNQFNQRLMNWCETIDRPMPWKGIKDPYRIWLSEIILQQTQVKQGLPFYEKFIANYPTVFDLANADEQNLMRDWAGLGYYNRARNLHHTAKDISKRLGGKFPDDYNDLLKLKGIGSYTAAAIASFAFDKIHAVVDGNVMRVLSRVFAIEEAVDTTVGRKIINELAQKLIDKTQPGIYNQAIMDFGATICTPKNPLCENCPMKKICKAFKQKRAGEFPVAIKKTILKERHLNYFVIGHNNQLLMKQRLGDDIWKGLYDFPMIETDKTADVSNLLKRKIVREWVGSEDVKLVKSVKSKHNLSHQKLFISFHSLHISKRSFKEISKRFKPIATKSLSDFALPKPVDSYIKKNYFC